MPVRRLLRGSVPQDTIDAVAAEAAERAGDTLRSVEVLEADNWLSTPCVVNDSHFLKIVGHQHALVHGLFTAGRNLGAVSSGRDRLFTRFETPLEMVEHELEATRQLRAAGIDAPEPRDAFEFDGYGVLVLEFLPSMRPLDALPDATAGEHVPELFGTLARMHDAGLAHGDLRAENVLVADGDLYVVDATKLREDDRARADARAYDLACALAAVEPIVGPREAVRTALEAYSPEDLRDADPFLSFVNIRPDHGFDAPALRGEIGKALA